jgi:methylmalonyl-CoA mutase N-terminal domain/subunit
VVHAPDRTVADRQRQQLVELKANRDQTAVDAALLRLREAAVNGENTMWTLMDCARVDATLGEMVDALKLEFGEFVEPAL